MIAKLPVANSEVSITRVAFGCARIHGGTELKASARLIESALGAGIRHFDTAPSYGDGQSEAVLGQVLAGVQDVTVATKIGISRPSERPSVYSWPVLYRRFLRPVVSYFPASKARLLRLVASQRRSGHLTNAAPKRKRLSREEVFRGLDESLTQLRRSRVDLYLIHEPDQFELTDELRETFDALVRSGAIGAYGLAWGRVADRGTGFGSVVQGRYENSSFVQKKVFETPIFHGILRASAETAGGPAGLRIRRVLDTNPDAAVIFSASTASQIRSVMQYVRES